MEPVSLQKKTTYIYKGQNISTLGCQRLAEASRKRADTIVADESEIYRWLNNPANRHKGDVLIIPGGRSMMVMADLAPHRELLVKNLRSGVNMLGFCAGANIGGSNATYEYIYHGENLKMELSGLGLLPVEARGPVFKSFQTKPVSLEAAERIKVKMDNKEYEAYYCHGPEMQPTQQGNHVEVLATYSTGGGAIVAGKADKSYVVLSGVHPEFTPEDVGIPYKDEDDENSREVLLDYLFQKVALPRREWIRA